MPGTKPKASQRHSIRPDHRAHLSQTEIAGLRRRSSSPKGAVWKPQSPDPKSLASPCSSLPTPAHVCMDGSLRGALPHLSPRPQAFLRSTDTECHRASSKGLAMH